MIIGEIGDIHRFSRSSKLLAFAGLDPSVYQSGNFSAKHTRMSKLGSRVLRYALMNAAHNVVKSNATFKIYYDTKMAEGRTHYNALGHCAGKLVRKFLANLYLTFHSWSPFRTPSGAAQIVMKDFTPLLHEIITSRSYTTKHGRMSCKFFLVLDSILISVSSAFSITNKWLYKTVH